MQAQARLRYYNGQKQDEEYWVLKEGRGKYDMWYDWVGG